MGSKTFHLKRLGRRILAEANDLKRTPEALANDLGYELSVIESVIPRSKKTTLPASLPPSILLGMLPNPFFPASVKQSYRNGSSDLLIINVCGIFPSHAPLLFVSLQCPLLPSLKAIDTGI